MNDKKGFTLFEVLLTLTILTVLVSIGFAFQTEEIEKRQIRQFIKTFQSDTLYVQQMTLMTGETYLLLINEQSNTYTIRKSGFSPTISTRKLPSDWQVSLLTLTTPVSFNFKGTVKKPGSLLIDTGKTQLKIIFPLGKGRCYVVEQ